MAFRLLISDAVWAEFESVLRDINHAARSPPVLNRTQNFGPMPVKQMERVL